MILSDVSIRDYIKRGLLRIDLMNDDSAIQPASVDLRLAASFTRFKKRRFGRRTLVDPTGCNLHRLSETFHALPLKGFILRPKEFALGSTYERVRLGTWVVGRVEGKSSLGRLGLSIHTTAGFIDPGFSGFITLELFNQSNFPIILYPGMWICQIAFQTLTSECERPYGKERGSRYTDQLAPVPVLSRISEKTGL